MISMILASGLGFIRLVILTLVLDTDQFGIYSALLGLAAMSGLIISFGSLESTTKYFPRQWATQDFAGIWHQVDRLYRQFGLRFAALGLLAMAIIASVAPSWLSFTVLVCIFGLALLILNLSASVVRATGDIGLIKGFNFLRGLLPLIVSVPLAFLYGWWVVVIGEIAATLVAAAIARHHCMIKTRSPDPASSLANLPPVPDDTAAVKSCAGFQIYISKLASSSVALADRAFIGVLAGVTVAGSYATLALFIQAGLLLSGIICQKIGPDIIKAVYRTGRLAPVRRHISQSIAYILAAGAVIFVFTWLAYEIDEVAQLLQSREVTRTAVALGCIALSTHFYTILEYILIAKNEERKLIFSGISAALVFFPLAIWVADAAPSAAGFIVCVIAARLVQLVVLGTLIWLSPPIPKGAPE